MVIFRVLCVLDKFCISWVIFFVFYGIVFKLFGMEESIKIILYNYFGIFEFIYIMLFVFSYCD